MEKKISNIKERILQVSEYYGISKEKFFDDLGITYGNFKGSAKERPVNSSFLEKILTTFPDLSPDWLLLGRGEILRNPANVNSGNGQQVIADHNSGTINADNRQYYSDSPDVLRREIEILNKWIKEKDGQIKEKDGQIKEKDGQINELLKVVSQLSGK